MKVISLDEYRSSHKPHKKKLTIQEIRERLEPTLRPLYKEILKEKLRQRLRERKRLQELKEKQSKPPTTKKK